VLFVFSPSGEGAAAAGLYQAGAERLGWIVVASNDARNGPVAPIRAAQDALWKEVFARYKADPGRVYASGFSGGARMAMALAEQHSDALRGLISIGAYGNSRSPGPGGLAHVLLCGEEDPNHAEMARAWERLRGARGRQVYLEHFPGGHQWAPAEQVEEGMVFLELATGWAGRQPRNPGLEAGFLERRLESARSMRGEADREQGVRRWRDLAALPGASEEAEARAKLLEGDPEARRALALEGSFQERSRSLEESRDYGPELQRLVGVAAGQGPEALDARRLVGRERGQMEERVWEALEAKAWERALLLGRGLVALGDRGARGGVYAAMALAMLGRKAEALAELEAAFARGYKPARPLGDQPLLAPLRGDPAFQALEARRP
jgi:dienelactone hydrolase